jgi:ubiquinone/menaquinone biosynthesis C-methylase UbiE
MAQDFGSYDPTSLNADLQMEHWQYGTLDIVSGITTIPESNASFDAVACIEVLEHVPDPVAAIRELSRLLRPRGSLILAAHFCSLTHFTPHHYATGFSRFFYEKWLPECGPVIEKVVPIRPFFQFLAQQLQRLPQVCARHSTPATFVQRLVTRAMLTLLASLERKDHCSSELLCFGFLVQAVRT